MLTQIAASLVQIYIASDKPTPSSSFAWASCPYHASLDGFIDRSGWENQPSSRIPSGETHPFRVSAGQLPCHLPCSTLWSCLPVCCEQSPPPLSEYGLANIDSSFQEIQHLSALQAALRILPSLVVGTLLNFSTGIFVHRIPAVWIVTVSSLLSAGAPLLMAVIQPQWPYWANAFVAQMLMPISADVLFTVGLIIITDVFPEDKQALAGAVFNTGAQFGNAFGLAIMQVISTLVSKDHDGMKPVVALMEGYRASFWTMFAMMLACGGIGWLGLCKTGKVGLKTD